MFISKPHAGTYFTAVRSHKSYRFIWRILVGAFIVGVVTLYALGGAVIGAIMLFNKFVRKKGKRRTLREIEATYRPGPKHAEGATMPRKETDND